MKKAEKGIKGIYERDGAFLVRIRRKNMDFSETFPFLANEESKQAALIEAIQWRDKEIRSIKQSGTITRSNADAITLKECIEIYESECIPTLRGSKQEKTLVKRVLEALKENRLENRIISELKYEQLEAFRDYWVNQGLANSTVNRIMNTIPASFKWLKKEHKVKNIQYFTDLRLTVKDRKTVTTEYDIVQEVIRRIESPLTQAGIELIFLTGGRRSEIALAKWEDVDFENGLIHIERSKNDDPRSLFLNSRAIHILNSIQGKRKTGYIFTDDKTGKTPFHIDTFSRAWGRGRQRLFDATQNPNVLKVSLHTLRHSFITLMVGKIDNPMEQKVFSGHRSIQMLERYYHPNSIKLKKKHGRKLELDQMIKPDGEEADKAEA